MSGYEIHALAAAVTAGTLVFAAEIGLWALWRTRMTWQRPRRRRADMKPARGRVSDWERGACRAAGRRTA